ncbi:MAG: hypothetical protein IPO90_02650 [Flavobacteriales bacterium]|nr:hypothetical protein [Flavobacteriales bacterium]
MIDNVRCTGLFIAFSFVGTVTAQLSVWAEEFENNCNQNCFASAYTGVNGGWTTASTGTNGACANKWFVSCQENGNPAGTCGTTCGNNETLHIGNDPSCISPNSCFFCPSGDCGAAYDASCPPALCSFCCSCLSSQTSTRAISPVIDLSGWGTLTLRFKYMEGGAGVADNAMLDYFDGSVWTQLADMPKTAAGSCGSQGLWTNYSIALPASASFNPNVRIGFRWVNNDDGSGADPSIAVDDIEILTPYVPTGSGLVVNELSNGPSGNKEYIELAVVGPGCTADIRGIKVDDNNGVANNGFGTLMNGSGVSIGHNRFSNAAQWATVPIGSLILIYNNADVNALVPAMDPSDTAPQDSIYILPANHVLLQGCGNYPDGLVTGTYPTCTYNAGSWTWMGYRDQGDAGQTRDANGRYFHGFSYGPSIQNMNNGGLDNLRITTLDGITRVIWFNSGDYRQAANFGNSLVAGYETPGDFNNPSNRIWMRALRCAVLPVELIRFEAEDIGNTVRLRWSTASESNSDHFLVDRSSDGQWFEPIASTSAAGNSQQQVDYLYDDQQPLQGISYYRLRQFDLDGAEHTGPVVAVVRQPHGTCTVNGDAAGIQAWFTGNEPQPWSLVDMTGRILASGTGVESPVRVAVPEGISLFMAGSADAPMVFRVLGTQSGVLVAEAR